MKELLFAVSLLCSFFRPTLVTASTFFFFSFWLHRIFVVVHRLSPLVASRGSSSCGVQASHCGSSSYRRAYRLQDMRPSVVHSYMPSSGGSQALERRLRSCGSCCVSAHLSLMRALALDLGLPSSRRTSSQTLHFIASAKTGMFPEKNQSCEFPEWRSVFLKCQFIRCSSESSR